jgi:hypothetical protein
MPFFLTRFRAVGRRGSTLIGDGNARRLLNAPITGAPTPVRVQRIEFAGATETDWIIGDPRLAPSTQAGAGHFLPLDRPRELLEQIVRFAGAAA